MEHEILHVHDDPFEHVNETVVETRKGNTEYTFHVEGEDIVRIAWENTNMGDYGTKSPAYVGADVKEKVVEAAQA